MLTNERVQSVAHDVLKTVVDGIAGGEVATPVASHGLFQFVFKAEVDDAGGAKPAYAVLYLAVLEDAQVAEDMEALLKKL